MVLKSRLRISSYSAPSRTVASIAQTALACRLVAPPLAAILRYTRAPHGGTAHETEPRVRDAATGGRRPRGHQGNPRAVRARRSDGLRHRLVRGASLPHELLDVAVPGGDLRRAEPADQADPPGIRRRDPALSPPRARRRARRHGRPHVVR